MNKDKNMGKSKPFWIENTPDTNYPDLKEGLTVDVAIIGAGIAGITSAILLKKAGLSVALIEAGKIIKDVTGHTTSKITAAHSVIYKELLKEHGEKKTSIYAKANQSAIDQIESLIKEYNIACDFRRLPCYIYTENKDSLKMIKEEAEAAKKVGLPVSYEESIPLEGFDVRGAVKYDNQAEFHPRKYLLGLTQKIQGDNCHIFENTRALNIKEGNTNEVVTDKGSNPLQTRDCIN